MSEGTADLTRRKGDYGFDAPLLPALMGATGVFLAVVGLVIALRGGSLSNATGPWLAAVFFLLSASLYVYTTRVGKFVVWADLLQHAGLRGDEHLLDMGSGRGAVLLMAAKLLPAGMAVGLDLWRSIDQSGNRMETALANAEAEGVRDRVQLHTGDMSEMPFPDDAFDIVLSSMSIHNIKTAAGRSRAVSEAVRVLRPGGRLLVADIIATGEYANRLHELRMEDVRRRPLGWRFWYGGPWVAASLVTARKPAAGAETAAHRRMRISRGGETPRM
ncbi:MAG TPA: class I SAM-dependent methyltransferase [Candidatus Dormibacteraeota bacterium]|nr:class I SAM-dependent methyltransferase [Candidatus Dormibacteraeota bacterium]